MLVEVAWVYEAAWALGYAATEVDAMELWQVARVLGIDRPEPIVKGTRSIQLPSDNERGRRGRRTPGGSRAAGFRDSRLAAREAEWARRTRGQQSP